MTYKPQAVLRVEIPKGNGKIRPLGIPTIKDRVVQMATKLVIELIFEADFEDSSHGFRPRRRASDAGFTLSFRIHVGRTLLQDFEWDIKNPLITTKIFKSKCD